MISEGLRFLSYYRTYSTHSDGHAWLNSVDPDQITRNMASDQDLQFATYPAFLHTFTISHVVK